MSLRDGLDTFYESILSEKLEHGESWFDTLLECVVWENECLYQGIFNAQFLPLGEKGLWNKEF